MWDEQCGVWPILFEGFGSVVTISNKGVEVLFLVCEDGMVVYLCWLRIFGMLALFLGYLIVVRNVEDFEGWFKEVGLLLDFDNEIV